MKLEKNLFSEFESILPEALYEKLTNESMYDSLVEIVLDYGFYPKLRLNNQEELELTDLSKLSKDDLQQICQVLPPFGQDNRTGIDATLHRISALRNRQNEIIGLTIRIGRSFEGSLAALEKKLASGKNILFLAPPGFGKTTKLREASRLLATRYNKRVMIVDSSNEIAGSGDIPHPCIGRARRIQVSSPDKQAQAMIEAVENHMPEVIVVDEIGTADKVAAAKTIAQRGVQLIGTAHGISLQNLMDNPMLADLLGGISPVILGDEEARSRGSQKTVLERQGPAAFDCLVELKSEESCLIYEPLETFVDAKLKNSACQPYKLESISSQSEGAECEDQRLTQENLEKVHIYLFGIKPEKLTAIINKLNVPAVVASNIGLADMILTTKQAKKNNIKLAQMLRGRQLPIHSISSLSDDILTHFLLGYFGQDVPNKIQPDDALAEIKAVCEKVMSENQVLELSPASAYHRQKQHKYVQERGLFSMSTGQEPQRRLRVFPR